MGSAGAYLVKQVGHEHFVGVVTPWTRKHLPPRIGNDRGPMESRQYVRWKLFLMSPLRSFCHSYAIPKFTISSRFFDR